ncbi:hypothetical protein GDO86_015029 [Hymenochirus boettgeri]|uniref:Inversin n=1 Tax=Hymenochirus boettgeri TaxID=247094 RepID=A0A8T2JWJ9_9PIPI|nr:hypothetical protein GDO86_015029 [Hymenochirus boettgeri]
MSCSPHGSSLASPVHAASITGDKATLLRLISSNSELINQEDQLGRTPLMYSVLGDRKCVAEALLKHGALVNHSDRSGRTALHLAAQSGNHRLLKLLLSRKADCTHRDLREITALHLSTRHQDTRCLALLLKYTPPGQVDAQDQRKQTALHWSAYYNRPRHVRLLVRHGSNIGIPDFEGKIPLHWAAGHKDPEAALTVRCLLEAAPTESLLNWQDYEGRTPLHLAVGDGNQEVVRLLTSYRGCNVVPYDNLFRTPLHWAALLGHTPIAHLLLERNNSPNIPSDSQGATPLHYAAQGNCPDTVHVLLAHPSVRDEADLEGRTAFMWAAGKGSDEALKSMLELDPELEVNRTDKYGGTALHAASLSGQISTVRILLESRAQVNAVDVMKHTPLFRACEMGHREVIYTLIKGGAKVHLVDKDGCSPLHWAALGGNANVCQILIENNINPNAQDFEGRTPLQCAAYGGYIGCMEVLMENKADPNIQDKNGRTALHWSCNNGYLDAVKLLLRYSAFPNQMEITEERYTPLDYALLGGHQEVIQFMLEHGALSIAAIQDIAASKIQAVYKGHKVRRAFQDRKNLLMKHEQLRKDAAAKKRECENKRKVRAGQTDERQKEERHLTTHNNSDKQIQDEEGNIQCSEEWFGKKINSNETGGNYQGETKSAEPKHLKHSLTQKQARRKGNTRYQMESPALVIHRAEDLVQKECSRKSHKEERKKSNGHKESVGSRSYISEQDFSNNVDIAEKCKKIGHRKSAVVSKMGLCSTTEADNERLLQIDKVTSNPVIQRREDCISSAHHRETPNKVYQERKSSAKARSFTDTHKPSGKPHRSPSSLLSSQITLPTTDRTHFNSSPASHIAVRQAIKTLHPRNAKKEGDLYNNWQNMDIELIPLEARLQLVEREKARKQLFQQKKHAAIVIQKAWRAYSERKHLLTTRYITSRQT